MYNENICCHYTRRCIMTTNIYYYIRRYIIRNTFSLYMKIFIIIIRDDV